jgi:hypothetical protein
MHLAPDMKSYVLGALMLGASSLFWFSVGKMAGAFSWHDTFGILSVVSLTCYLVVASLALMLYQERRLFVGVVAIGFVPFFLSIPFRLEYVLLVLLALLAASRSFSSVKDELHNHLAFRVSPPLRRGLPILLTVFSLMLASVYYFTTGSRMSVSGEDLLPKSLFNLIIKTTEPNILQLVLPGFNRLITVDEYIRETLRRDAGGSFDVLSPAQQAELLRHARTQLFQDFNLQVGGDELLSDAFYQAIIAKSEHLLEPYKRSIPFAFAIALFLFLRTVAFPYSWLVICTSWGIMRLLIRLRVVEIQEVQRPQEFVTWRHIG